MRLFILQPISSVLLSLHCDARREHQGVISGILRRMLLKASIQP